MLFVLVFQVWASLINDTTAVSGNAMVKCSSEVRQVLDKVLKFQLVQTVPLLLGITFV